MINTSSLSKNLGHKKGFGHHATVVCCCNVSVVEEAAFTLTKSLLVEV